MEKTVNNAKKSPKNAKKCIKCNKKREEIESALMLGVSRHMCTKYVFKIYILNVYSLKYMYNLMVPQVPCRT